MYKIETEDTVVYSDSAERGVIAALRGNRARKAQRPRASHAGTSDADALLTAAADLKSTRAKLLLSRGALARSVLSDIDGIIDGIENHMAEA